jgi:hypothetical protein
MKALACTMVLLLVLCGVAFADQALPAAHRAGVGTPLDQHKGDSSPGKEEGLLTIVKARTTVALKVDLRGDLRELEGPQVGYGKDAGNGKFTSIKRGIP